MADCKSEEILISRCSLSPSIWLVGRTARMEVADERGVPITT